MPKRHENHRVANIEATRRGGEQYPAPFSWFFPDRGNFLAIVSNFLPVIAAPAPERIPGIGWSDHWSFWQQGYPAVMLTDTAPYRNPNYSLDDTPDTIDYDRLARVVTGCAAAVRRLAA